MIDRIASGQSRLDEVLGGGFPIHAINLIAGSPGTGKTMLAQQYLFNNATAERPGLYLTTTSEPLDKVVRYGQGLEFFHPAAVGTSIIYESLASQLIERGLDGVGERILQLVRDVRPGLVVIDSFKAFAPHARDPLEYRSFISELAGRLSPLPINTFWVGEYGLAELPDLPEAAVADAIVVLRSVASGQRTARYLQVLKLRGGDFLSGEHAYRLSAAGLHVFPRLADPVLESPAGADLERLSTGIPGLDAMLGGGIFRGSTTLIIGPSGAGKTIVSLEFLTAGARRGAKGVFASLQENPTQMARILEGGRGQELDGKVEIHRRSPVDVYIDEWVYDVLERVDRADAQLLAIDSLTDLRIASPDPKRFEEYSYSLTQRLGQLGITTVMTLESPPSLGFADLPSSAISHLADNLIILGYQLAGSTVRRGVHVLKARASSHDPQIREFTIGSRNVTIGEPMDVPQASPPARPQSDRR